MTQITIKLTREQHATILAALRFYQHSGGGGTDRPGSVVDIASDCGGLNPLNDDGIDRLCEKLNR